MKYAGVGVHHLIACCHNDACRHQELIDVSRYADHLEVAEVSVAAEVRQVRG
jgi:hypothetical protein